MKWLCSRFSAHEHTHIQALLEPLCPWNAACFGSDGWCRRPPSFGPFQEGLKPVVFCAGHRLVVKPSEDTLFPSSELDTGSAELTPVSSGLLPLNHTLDDALNMADGLLETFHLFR